MKKKPTKIELEELDKRIDNEFEEAIKPTTPPLAPEEYMESDEYKKLYVEDKSKK